MSDQLITVEEKFGRVLSDDSAELTYIVRGTEDDGEAHDALAGHAPTMHRGLDRDDIEVEEVGTDLWLGMVRYRTEQVQTSSSLSVGESSFSFDTGGGTQHITQGLATVGAWALPDKTPANFHGAIGVTRDAVEGVDITVPVYQFSETHHLPLSAVNDVYKQVMFFLTGRVNIASFRGLGAGECLFLGASGSRSGNDGWQITYRFAGSPNRFNFDIGEITGVDKLGWDYMWVRYADAEDAGAKVLVKKPVSVYVERVYEFGDFNLLGIGS